MKADIYIETNSRSWKMTRKRYAYVLECSINGEPKTREGFGEAEGTFHTVTLTALAEAFGRFKRPSEICIHGQDIFVMSMIKTKLPEWAGNGFLTSSGRPIANRELWEALWDKASQHQIETVTGKHSYTEWMIKEMKKRENNEQNKEKQGSKDKGKVGEHLPHDPISERGRAGEAL